MITQLKNRIINRFVPKKITEFAAEPAYDLWAQSYDTQPDNLMLVLDTQIFTVLLKMAKITDQTVADFGCGTGRHWPKILALKPRQLTGFDVSAKMLEQLKHKYPEADVVKIDADDDLIAPKATFDVLISTLAIAHFEDIDKTIKNWADSLKPDGRILITDFHPEALSIGGERTFNYHGQTISIVNCVHPIKKLLSLFQAHGFTLTALEERFVDENVRHYYEQKHALAVYQKFKNRPIIYGMLLTRSNDAAE